MKDASNKGFALKLKRVIGILLIIVGGVSILLNWIWLIYLGDEISNSIKFSTLGNIIIMGGGIAVYMMKNLDTKAIIGTTGILIGVSDIVSAGTLVSMDFSLTDVVSMIIVSLTLAIPMADLFLIIFSIRYMQGHRRNAMRMAICVFIPLFIYLFMIFFYLGPLSLEGEYLLSAMTVNIPPAILYGVFLWFLLLPGVREDLSGWKVYKVTRDLYRSEIVEPKSSIYRGHLIELNVKMNDMKLWDDSTEFPGAKECHLNFGKDMNVRRMTFRKMADSETIRVSIIKEGTKEYIQAVRFNLKEIVPLKGDYRSCPAIRFFGEDGFFIDITVRDDKPLPRKTYAIDRLIDRMKFSKVNKRKD